MWLDVYMTTTPTTCPRCQSDKGFDHESNSMTFTHQITCVTCGWWESTPFARPPRQTFRAWVRNTIIEIRFAASSPLEGSN